MMCFFQGLSMIFLCFIFVCSAFPESIFKSRRSVKSLILSPPWLSIPSMEDLPLHRSVPNHSAVSLQDVNHTALQDNPATTTSHPLSNHSQRRIIIRFLKNVTRQNHTTTTVTSSSTTPISPEMKTTTMPAVTFTTPNSHSVNIFMKWKRSLLESLISRFKRQDENATTTSTVSFSTSCGDNCSPGYQCGIYKQGAGPTCLPCDKGKYSLQGLECIPCPCAITSTTAEVCSKTTGKCFCDNFLNLCRRIAVFGSTSTLLWVVILIGTLGAIVALQFRLQNKNKQAQAAQQALLAVEAPADQVSAAAINQAEIMMRLQQQLSELQGTINISAQQGDRKMSSGGADKDRKRPGEIMSSKGIKQSTTRSGMLAQRLKTTGNLGKGNEKSIISTRSDLDEVTTAILNAAKGKIQEATKVSKDRLKRLGPNTSRGVEGDFYIDRVTGKRVKDISMDADDEGEVMSVMFPQPDAKPIFRQEENNTDVVMPRSYTKMDDDDVKSLHFGELTTVQGSEKDMPSGKRRGRGLKKKLIRNIM